MRILSAVIHRVRILRMLAVVCGGIGLLSAAPSQATVVSVIEFYNATLDHYFISSLAADIQALDSGQIPGWTRTGYSFLASDSPGAGLNAVCRYLIPPQHGNSHFFSASRDECAAVAQKVATDPNYSGYVLETASAFYIALPDTTTGACPAGTVPVYRLWNHRADSNHRYTTDVNIRLLLIVAGYVPEGYGPDGVAMCAQGAARGESQVRVSQASPFPPGCDGVVPSTGTRFINAEVEPYVAIDPTDPMHFIGVWQQDRWSDGGAAASRTGVSFDGGLTWTLNQPKFTRCAGGTVDNGGNWARSSDPWVSIGPDGTVYQSAIAFVGDTLAPGSAGAVLVSRSTDRGVTWSDPIAVIDDGSNAFNDKDSITADATQAGFAYAVWDRLGVRGGGPSYFARTTNGGASWETARAVYDPGSNAQTLNNQVVVLPDGTVILFFNEISPAGNRLAVMRSGDKGVTWSIPTYIATVMSLGAEDGKNGIPVRDAADLGSIAVGRNGKIAVAWQDARFNSSLICLPSGDACHYDEIAYSQSVDGGVTWSTPVRVNSARAQSFIPTIAIRDDGTVGVTYYDNRNDTTDPNVLLTDIWLTTTTDGMVWSERHVSGPFDYAQAPIVEDGNENGYFLGDYQGLGVSGAAFVPLFARTAGNPANLTDILASYLPPQAPQGAVLEKSAPLVSVMRATPLEEEMPSPEFAQRAQKTLRRVLARRFNP